MRSRRLTIELIAAAGVRAGDWARPRRLWPTLWLSAWLALMTLPGAALDPRRSVTQYGLDVFQDGLPQQSVHAVLQTRDGYLWCATYEGVARFNGVSFTVFDRKNTPALKSNSVWALCEDRSGALWLGTLGGGLVRYQNGEFTTLTKADGLANDFVYVIREGPDGALWVGTDGGLSRLRDGRWTTYAAAEGLARLTARALRFDRAGTLWVGTEGGGLYRFADERLIRLTAEEGAAGDTIYAIDETRDGTLWIGFYGVGLAARRNGQMTLYREANGLPGPLIWTLREDRAGTLWIGTDGGGAARFRAGRFETFAARDGLTQNFVRSLYEDREGSLWLGTNAGLTRLRDTTVTVFGVAQGLPADSVRSICEDRDGTLWIGTDGGGVCRLDGHQVTAYGKAQGIPNDAIRSIFPDRAGGVWIGANGGGAVLLRNGKVVARYNQSRGLSSDSVYAICQDRAGDVWIGTYGGGLNRLAQGALSRFTTENGLPNNTIRCLLPDRKGGVWIGTNGGGVCRWRDGGFAEAYRAADGLASDTVFALSQDEDGTLWIGTETGLSRLRDGRLASVTSRAGLYEDKIFHILADADGFLWMSCNQGVFRVQRADLEAVLDGTRPTLASKAYGIPDGMKTRQCNGASSPAGWATRNGELWFPTSRGAARFIPRELAFNPLPPPVVIEQAIVNGELRLSQPAAQAVAEFPREDGRVEIHYAGLSFLIPTRVRFRFRLEGYDRDWIEAGDRRAAFYTNLSAGRYVFRVQACNNDGVWNEVGATYAFYLRPPLWRRWWAILLYAAILTGSVYSGARWRLGIVERRAARLEAIVAERTAEVVRQRDEIATQRMEILDSIRYAERIQRSMLDYGARAAAALREHCILFLPKDIVSGDFYWIDQTGDGAIVAVGDCTGHGVPGALLSMVGSAALAQIVRSEGIAEPATILERLDVSLRQTLQSKADSSDAPEDRATDGMEIAICHIDFQRNVVTFAGAGRPLYYYAAEEGLDAEGCIRELRGNRRPIGGSERYQAQGFASHRLPIGREIVLYLTSDGFADQPGGEKGRSYGVKALRRRLGELCNRPLAEQKAELLAELRRYQGDLPQRDDIVIVGIRLRGAAGAA